MSQHDMNIANQGFPAFRSDLNDALAALASTSAGATAPSTTFAQQLWYDSTNNLLKMRNTDNDAWITLAYFDQTNDEWEVRSAVIQAVDSAGVVIKTDDGTTRLTIADDGTVTVAGTLDVDTIAEKTAGSGVTIDGVLLKDNKIAKSGLPSDSVLQVKHSIKLTTTSVTTSSTTFQATGVSATITPISASSKIYISIQGGGLFNASVQGVGMYVTVYRSIGGGSATEVSGDATYGLMRYSGTSGLYVIAPMSGAILDSPSTTSEIEYEIYFKSSNSGSTVDFDGIDRGSPSITLMEIAG